MHYILLFLLFFFNSAWASPSVCSEKQCIGVVDVGSTGSRLHVYTHETEQTEEIWVKKITPGFANLKPESQEIHQYLETLFEGAPEGFPVYFYATAGMRLLPNETQAAHYAFVADWFKSTPWELKEAKTITGREEGVFAWLALYEHLKQAPGAFVPEHLSVMDMGGASVQVVSEVDHQPNNKSRTDYIEVFPHGEKHTLFVHSFLGLGKAPVAEQFLDDPSCFSRDYPLTNGLLGEGNPRVCAAHISKLINEVHDVHHILHQAFAHHEVKTWYVLAGLAYLLEEAPFKPIQSEVTNEGLITQADVAVCNRPWADVLNAYPNGANLSRACLTASYYHALMHAYDIAPQESIHLLENTPDMDWTLGVALHQT